MKKPPVRWLFCVWGNGGKRKNRKWKMENSLWEVEMTAVERWRGFLILIN
jgi:hypothetical protein